MRRGSITIPAKETLGTLALCLSLLALVQSGRAQDPARVQLRWMAPPECPQQAVILARIVEYTGTSASSNEPVQAEARVARMPDGRYALELRLAGPAVSRADRSLSTGSCEAAAQAAALLIAMALDPNIADRAAPLGAPLEASPAGSSVKGPQAPTLASQPVAPAHPATPAAATTPIWGVGTRALIDAGSFPGVNLGFGAQIEAKLAWLRLTLGGALFFPSEGPVRGLPTTTVDISAVMAAARVCTPLSMGVVELGPCVLGELGALRGEAEGIRQSSPRSALWLAIGAALQSRLALGTHWAAVLDTGLVVPNARRRFLLLTDAGTLSAHRVAPAALRIGFGVSYEFQ